MTLEPGRWEAMLKATIRAGPNAVDPPSSSLVTGEKNERHYGPLWEASETECVYYHGFLLLFDKNMCTVHASCAHTWRCADVCFFKE